MVSTILLDRKSNYVGSDGNLPKHPAFIKDLIKALIQDSVVSVDGYSLLPYHLQTAVEGVTEGPNVTAAVTIREIAAWSTLLIVVRSDVEVTDGKRFRFSNFKRLVKHRSIELWVRKTI